MLYYGSGGTASTIYLYEITGKELKDKQAVVNNLTNKISASESFIGFEWLGGHDCNTAKNYVYKKTKNSNITRCQGEFHID